jgi:DNA-binding MurR/RpiR family transcriptional regulator
VRAREQMLERFASLSPKLQAAARFAVDHPNEVVIASMRTLAERAGAQPATLVRLAQQLGYAGWPQLKAAFAEDMGLNSERYGERAKSLAVRGRSADLAGELFHVQRQNLASTEAQCAASLRDVARTLGRAKAVHIAGFRASFPVAYALFYGYRLFRHTVHLIDGSSGGLEAQLRPIQRQDAVVAISFAPYSREALWVIEQAKAAGARIVAMTDSSASPLALAADLPLLFSVQSPSFFPSVAAAVALTEALLERLVADGGAAVARQIDRAERRLFESGAYLKSPQPRAGART